MIDEIWKDIKGYEGSYQVSNYGRVRSLDRVIDINNGLGERCVSGRILKPKVDKCGYLCVTLSIRNKCKCKKIHRLVAEAFISNPCDFPEVNHKNENKRDNKIENIEWCNRKYNINYGTRNIRSGMSQRNHPNKSKQICQIDSETKEIIKIWPSASEIQRVLNFLKSDICKCCNGKRNKAYGFIWKFAQQT